ncbi:unnamed protein product [Cunninghamella blakesleeana]
MTNSLAEEEIEKQIESLLRDSILSDISSKTTLKEIDQLIAVELNQAFKIKVKRDPLPPIDIIVQQSSTIKDIKLLFQQEWEKQNKRKVSWKYIWRTYCLQLDKQKLLNDDAIISQLGFQQGSIVLFNRLDFDHNKKKHRKAWQWYKH